MQAITTIKLQQRTKEELDQVRRDKESYDLAIQRLLETGRRKHLHEELIRGYQSLGKDDLILLQEWDAVSLNHD